jgi:hydrogenase maturation factor
VTVEHDLATAGGECITCGDIAVAGVVVEVDGRTATVEVEGVRERVGVELVAPVSLGERLLCHAGVALARLDDLGDDA